MKTISVCCMDTVDHHDLWLHLEENRYFWLVPGEKLKNFWGDWNLCVCVCARWEWRSRRGGSCRQDAGPPAELGKDPGWRRGALLSWVVSGSSSRAPVDTLCGPGLVAQATDIPVVPGQRNPFITAVNERTSILLFLFFQSPQFGEFPYLKNCLLTMLLVFMSLKTVRS